MFCCEIGKYKRKRRRKGPHYTFSGRVHPKPFLLSYLLPFPQSFSPYHCSLLLSLSHLYFTLPLSPDSLSVLPVSHLTFLTAHASSWPASVATQFLFTASILSLSLSLSLSTPLSLFVPPLTLQSFLYCGFLSSSHLLFMLPLPTSKTCNIPVFLNIVQ